MSLLESTAATATIKAAEDDTEILTIPLESFQRLCRLAPQIENALRERIQARRLKNAEAVQKAVTA
jgi:CRP-like cAMP-binding protein